MRRRFSAWILLCALASPAQPSTYAPLAGFTSPVVLNSELTVVVETEGERIEARSYGRCIIRPVFTLLEPGGVRPEYLRDGSLPAIRLPSGAAIMFGSRPAPQWLDPCKRLQGTGLLVYETPRQPTDPQTLHPPRFTLLEEGETAHFNLPKLFARRDGTYVAWLDDAERPTEVIGYVDNGLLNNPGAKFRLVDVRVRRLGEAEWGAREPTRIEQIVPWVARYCPAKEKIELKEKDHGWQWQGPYAVLFPVDELPDGPLKERLASLTSGVHEVGIDEVDAVPELREGMLRGRRPLHGFTWLGDDRIRLDPANPLPPDTMYFYPAPPPYVVSGFVVAIADRELAPKDGYHYHPYYYDADAGLIVRLNWSRYFHADQCTTIVEETQQ